jgi:G3E family GTPase
LRLETKVTWPYLQAALETLSRRYRGRLVRIKGVVHLTDQNHPVIVHGEAGRVHPPVSLPDGPSDDTQGRLVFITDGIVNKLIEDLMTVIRANHEDYKVTRH